MCLLKLLPVALLISVTLSSAHAELTSGATAAVNYSRLCSSCHGPELTGGQGASLISQIYLHGTSDESVAHSIRAGYLDKGMPGWSGVLSENDIQALVDFIKNHREENSPERLAQLDKEAKQKIVNASVKSELYDFHLKIVAETDKPFGMAVLPDGRVLVTEVAGRLRVIEKGGLLPEPVKGTPAGHPSDGVFNRVLLDVAVHPDYQHNRWIYLVCADAARDADGNPSVVETIVRGRLRNNSWMDSETLVQVPVANTATGRLTFDGKGYMYLATSVEPGVTEARDGKPFGLATLIKMPPQDLGDPILRGKILRFHDDGRIPVDNPFINTPGAAPIWSFGHRNPQGLAIDPSSGWLWSTEHGPRGGDELNLIRPGHNYGFPVISYGTSYNGITFTAEIKHEGMEQPVINWTPSIGVSNIVFYEGNVFQKWKRNLFIGSLVQEELYRVVLDGEQVKVRETLLKGLGRIRNIASGSDGQIYLEIELKTQGVIVRLMPDKR